PGRSRRLIRHHDRLHQAPPCIQSSPLHHEACPAFASVVSVARRASIPCLIGVLSNRSSHAAASVPEHPGEHTEDKEPPGTMLRRRSLNVNRLDMVGNLVAEA